MTEDKMTPEETAAEASKLEAAAAPKDKEHDDADDILELVKALALAAVIALTIRSFLFEPFNIPSGSMLPTLQVGDYLFVEKYAYGYSRYSFPLDIVPFEGRILGRHPERGDVAVFRQPKRPDIDYIKRIIGLPGDRIQVRSGILYINGDPVTREFKGREAYEDGHATGTALRYVETLPEGLQHSIFEMSDNDRLDNTPVYYVPQGYYFAMGDNRDRSQDSRVQSEVGFVPAENLVGRAFFIFFSTAGVGDKCENEGTFAALETAACTLVEWPKAIRFSRIFRRVRTL